MSVPDGLSAIPHSAAVAVVATTIHCTQRHRLLRQRLWHARRHAHLHTTAAAIVALHHQQHTAWGVPARQPVVFACSCKVLAELYCQLLYVLSLCQRSCPSQPDRFHCSRIAHCFCSSHCNVAIVFKACCFCVLQRSCSVLARSRRDRRCLGTISARRLISDFN